MHVMCVFCEQSQPTDWFAVETQGAWWNVLSERVQLWHKCPVAKWDGWGFTCQFILSSYHGLIPQVTTLQKFGRYTWWLILIAYYWPWASKYDKSTGPNGLVKHFQGPRDAEAQFSILKGWEFWRFLILRHLKQTNRGLIDLINPSDLLMHWLIDLLIGWLVDWLIGWLVDWLIGWLIDWLIDWLIGWLVGWLVDWSVGRLISLLLDWYVYLM